MSCGVHMNNFQFVQEPHQHTFSFDKNPFDESYGIDSMFEFNAAYGHVSLFDLFADQESTPLHVFVKERKENMHFEEKREKPVVIRLNGVVIDDVQEHAEIRAIIKKKHWRRLRRYRSPIQNCNFLMVPRK